MSPILIRFVFCSEVCPQSVRNCHYRLVVSISVASTMVSLLFHKLHNNDALDQNRVDIKRSLFDNYLIELNSFKTYLMYVCTLYTLHYIVYILHYMYVYTCIIGMLYIQIFSVLYVVMYFYFKLLAYLSNIS